jgi:hypothetical protein
MLRVEIRVKGHICPQWTDRLGGLTISHPDPDESLLAGVIADQAALYGIFSGLRDLGLKLTSVSSEEVPADPPEGR